jgi:hypothetical protein
MKNYQKLLVFLLLLLVLNAQSFTKNKKSLVDIYKKGKIKFIQELVISDDSLPENIFFESASSIACGKNGNIYVCDYKANNIKMFNSKGEFLKIIGKKGQGPGDFSWPFRIEVTENRLVVWELRNQRISLLDLNGNFIKSIKFSLNRGWPNKIRVLPDNKIVIEIEKIFYNEKEFPQECRIELYTEDIEYIKTIYSKRLCRNKYITKPIRTNVPQPYNLDVYWDVLTDGKIVIGYSEDYEIEVYDPFKGKLYSFTHEYKPVEINKKDKEEFFAGMVTSRGGTIIKRGAPDYIVKNTKFPKYKPAFNSIITDSEGNIWVHPYRKNRKEEGKCFDVFDKKGKFISEVKIIGSESYPLWGKIINGYLWKIRINKDGLYEIVKYRISD